MAIYHLSTKPISRAKGQSAVASASYRAGVKLEDKRIGKTFDYTKRSGLAFEVCIDKAGNPINRNELWNLAEASETRKDSRVAREYVIAIPHELIEKDLKKAVDVTAHFSLLLAEKFDVAVDIAIHHPDKDGDNRNYHAHIMTTTRKFERTANGINLTDKSDIELSNRKLKELNKLSTQEQIKSVRKLWADVANHYLSDDKKIDHRSFEERKIDKLPTVKLGWKASQMERKGIKTERGDINRQVFKHNKRIKELKEEKQSLIIELEQEREQERQRKAEPPKPYIEPPHYRKTDCGWRLHDSYNKLFNIHNNSIEAIKDNQYTKQDAAQVMQQFYSTLEDVYSDIDKVKDTTVLSRTAIEDIKKSTDELKDNYKKFITSTILKDDETIQNAQQEADAISKTCFSNTSSKAELQPERQSEIKEPSHKPTFRL